MMSRTLLLADQSGDVARDHRHAGDPAPVIEPVPANCQPWSTDAGPVPLPLHVAKQSLRIRENSLFLNLMVTPLGPASSLDMFARLQNCLILSVASSISTSSGNGPNLSISSVANASNSSGSESADILL